MEQDRDVIVYVEDNELNMKLMGEILHIAGLEMHGSPDGEGLVELVARARPLVVLLDIQLPKRSGIELLRDLRSDPRTAPAPVFAVTAFADGRSGAQLKEAGFDRIFTKPINVREILATLAAMHRPEVPS